MDTRTKQPRHVRALPLSDALGDDAEIRDRKRAAQWFEAGFSAREVSRRLRGKCLRTIQRWQAIHREYGRDELIHRGTSTHRRGGRPEGLGDDQISQLREYLREQRPVSVREVLEWVSTVFGVTYSDLGMNRLLKRHDMKLHSSVPGRRGKLPNLLRVALRSRLRRGKIRDVKGAINWVERKYGIHYTYSGMYDLLRREGFRLQVDPASGKRILVDERRSKPRKHASV